MPSAFFAYKSRNPLVKRYLTVRPYRRNFFSYYSDPWNKEHGVNRGMMFGPLVKNLNRIHCCGYDFEKRSYYG